jgi:hypothetical protein
MEAISRRTAITGACGILLLSGLGEIPAAANSAVKKLANGRLSVQLKRIPELAKVGGSVSIGNVKGAPVAITRTGTSSYTAFSLNCPHQNVKVTKTESGFKSNGDLVMGPATTRLVRVPIKVSRGVATVG